MVQKKGSVGAKLGEIRYSGVFNYEQLYLAIHGWLKDHYYQVKEVYKHKTTPSGADIELNYKGERKESEFIKFHIDVDAKFWGLTDTEVVKDGKKQKLNKARLLIIINFKVTLDYQSHFDKSEFLVRLFNFMTFTVLKNKIMMTVVGKLFYESYRLHARIKEELGMHCAYNAY